MDSAVSALSVVVSVVTADKKGKKFLQNVIDRPIRMHEVFYIVQKY
jgi:hypothetical protein